MSDPLSIFIGSVGAFIWLMLLLIPFLNSEFRRRGFKPVDHDTAQAKADELWAPARVRAGK